MAFDFRCGLLLHASVAGLVALLASATAHAEPCNKPADCSSGFCVDGVCCDAPCTDACHACSAAAKGQGDDGVCGLKVAGKVCVPAHCDDGLSFIQDALCDGAGNCLPPPPGVSCVTNNPCKFDLCSEAGCETATKLDGTDCGGGQVCVNGVCGGPSSSSSSSSSTSGNAGTGGAGTGGSGGDGASASGGGGPYPPILVERGCGCRTSGGEPGGVALAAALAVIGAWRRRRR